MSRRQQEQQDRRRTFHATRMESATGMARPGAAFDEWRAATAALPEPDRTVEQDQMTDHLRDRARAIRGRK